MKTNFLKAAFGVVSLSFLFFPFFSLRANNVTDQSYQSLWNKAERFEKESLPQSALNVVNEIFQKASDENKSPERIKAIIYQLKFETAINQDVIPKSIKKIEQIATGSKNPVEQALLYSILAGLYNDYYSQNQWTINQRTDLVNYIPDDIEEWTKNIFFDKIEHWVDLSIQNAPILQNTPINDYKAILNEGESSRNLRPTVYDFLVYRSIDLLNRTQYQKDFTDKILNLYRDLIVFREKENDAQALLFVQLDQVEFIHDHSRSETIDQEYLDTLEKLKKEYEAYDFCAEIICKEAVYYYNNQYNANDNYSLNKTALKKSYELCLEGIGKYPRYERVGLLQNLLNQITQSELKVNADNTIYPGQTLNLRIKSKNFNELTIKIYKINASVDQYTNTWSRDDAYKEQGVLILQEELVLPNEFSYLQSDTCHSILMKELGNYEYVIYANGIDKSPANRHFSVSSLATFSTGLSDEREYLVVDRMTGKPIEGATVDFYQQRSGSIQKTGESVKTNKLGLAFGSSDRNISAYRVSYEKDTALVLSNVPYVSVNYGNTNQHFLSLFTDRSIYRPGQTVFFKGIAYRTETHLQEVVSGKKYTISLYDANGKQINSKEFVTNEYGSFAGEFILPQGLLNGSFFLRSDEDNAWQNIQVEEYKRPTFDIHFTENTKTYLLGDEVSIEGNAKSFSGILMENVELTYRIIRKNQGYFFRMYSPPVQIASGIAKTDESGNFTINFIAEKDENSPINNSYYIYTVEANLTDSKGETQTSSTSVRIGEKSMLLNFSDFSVVMLKENLPSLRINAMNLSMKPLKSIGEYKIYRLTQDAKPDTQNTVRPLENNTYNLENYIIDRLVFTGNFNTEETLSTDIIRQLTPGAYRIVATSKDDLGRDIEAETNFILGSEKDKKPPVQADLWCLTPKTTCAVGETAQLILGSSLKNVSVLYQLFQEGKQISASRFELNDQNKTIEIPFLESYGKGITAGFIFVKNGQVYTKTVDIFRKQEDKKLNLKLEVFRDHLTPGQKEEWKISVKDGENKSVLSELLAAMYDASLDKLLPHFWNFNPVPSIWLKGIRFNQGSEFSAFSTYSSKPETSVAVPQFSFDSFNWFGWQMYHQMLYSSGLRKSSANLTESSAGRMLGEVAVSDMMLTQEESVLNESVVVNLSSAEVSQTETPVQLRQNFNETAFFYPQLKTNEAGETLISFTLPESNTTWKFTALAHTKDLKSGQISQEVISQKKLMVSPNMPRFIREGDKTSVSTMISNLSDETISGKVYIECFDPLTEKRNILVPDNSQSFSLDAGKSGSVVWMFDVPSGIDLSAIKIVAQSENFSDGEQHLIPVLPNKILVTESLPITITGKQTKKFQLDKLAKNTSATLENYRLSLEFASNPVWYAVQALPTITNPSSEDVISWFAAYYGNTLAAFIANSTPKLKQMIEAWTKNGGNKETLVSNLEKNQELKMALLEETPWVLAAENETEQKQRLSLLFDLNRNSYQNNQALEKLQSLQTWDGGWSWFKGMEGNVSITQWILYGMGNLKELQATAFPDEILEMQTKAIGFIDKKFLTHFNDWKKYNKDWKNEKTLSSYELEYLWVRSMYPGIKQEQEVAEAADFYLNILKNNWTKLSDIYVRTISILVLNRNGETKTAGSILKSLREHASRSQESGMYWANLKTSAFMFQSATCIHAFIMEAFSESGASAKEMDEMKLWLLKQKQVQHWESVPATVNAIYILLKTGSNWLDNKESVTIQWGNQTVDTRNSELGTGYIKETLVTEAITSDKARIEITKKDEGPAWGALYWQYYEETDKIRSSKTGLNVEKSLFIEKLSGTKKELIPVNAQNPIKIGDKVIVRLTVRSDRDFEYVQLKDMRASAFEPLEQLSGIGWAQNAIYYQSMKDASMNYYFYSLPKGTYVFEYSLYTNRAGNYSNGISTIQCLYAPEFISHTGGERVNIE